MLRNFIIFSTLFVLVLLTFGSQAMALTQDSQNILNRYHNFIQSGFSPATSHIYSPNSEPSVINAVPVPKTNLVSPTSSQSPYSPTSSQSLHTSTSQAQSPTSQVQSQTSLQGNEQMGQSWIVVLVVLLASIAVTIGAVKKGRSARYNHPPSMKQLETPKSVGYNGPMPISSKEDLM